MVEWLELQPEFSKGTLHTWGAAGVPAGGTTGAVDPEGRDVGSLKGWAWFPEVQEWVLPDLKKILPLFQLQ